MTPNRHRIQRQVVELTLGGGLESHAVQESLAHAFREEWIPELTALFDRTAGVDHLLRLDRLEISLGTITAHDWQPELRRRLGIELAQQLARFVPEPGTPGSRATAEPLSKEPWRQFRFFLEWGRIPWWGERPSSGWRESLTAASIHWPALCDVVRTHTHARARLIDALDDSLLQLAVEKWGGVPHAASAVQWILRRLGVALPARASRHRAWRLLLDAALEPGALLKRGPEVLRKLLELRVMADPLGAMAREPAAGAAAAPEPDGAHFSAQMEELPLPWRAWLAEASRSTAARLARHESPEILPIAAVAAAVPAAPAADEESIYLPGAGAVVLHPFVEALFRDRGLLEGSTFRDEASRERAVRLFGLLSFGSREVPEYDLVAAKLLCGHPLETPLAPAELDDADASACDELLTAVLRHWSALRSSSADWLRTQFFLRDGKLEQVDEGFRLTVERRAQDVLLGRLPWGIGVIGFPWMKEKIFVRWLD